MFSYRVDIYEKNAWQELGDVALPITDGEILDDTLDEGRIDIKNTTRAKSIKPFTRLRIVCYENDIYVKKIQRVVGSARRTRKRNTSSALYDWSIQTLELTKLLERDFIGSMTATRPKAPNPYARVEVKSARSETFNPYVSMVAYWTDIDNSLNRIKYTKLPSYRHNYVVGHTFTFDYDWAELQSGIWWGINNTKIYFNQTEIEGTTLTQKGEYTIVAQLYSRDGLENVSPVITSDRLTVTWVVNAVDADALERKLTISSVTQRLLYAGVTRRTSQAVKYTLNEAFDTKYEHVNAPEFAFTNSTLLDALFQIGGAIHAIPRLQVKNESEDSDDLEYEVTFDELGGSEEVGNLMPQWVSEEKNVDINNFCDTLDSPAQNLVNSVDIEKGCISEFGQDYITIRAENNQVEISADTMAIRTSLPIQQLVKLECSYAGITDDLTPYVYEMAEYNTLSSLLTEAYPNSKGYALCYSIGGDTITGLNNKPTTATILDNLNSQYQYAIVNILNVIRGTTYDSTSFNYVDLAFRVTYVPIVSARVTQKKPIKGETEGNTLVYNQGANLVETSAYGQKMRGAIARLGLEATLRTYDFTSFANLPKVGQKIDGEYIVQVDCAYYPTKIRATLLLTPNFNQISQYIGLNTNYRLYDISERQTIDRFITYGETIEVGDNKAYNADAILPRDLLLASIKWMIGSQQNAEEVGRIDTAMTAPLGKDNIPLGDGYLLPVTSFAFGQSLAFVCAFLDNYGVGYQASDDYGDNSDKKRVQRLVPYSDMFGEFENLTVYYKSGSVFGDQEQPYEYPLATGTTIVKYMQDSQMSTGGYPFVVQKDSAERIGLTYQAHFQANRESVVIGRAMTENCPLVTNATARPVHLAYSFNHEINNLATYDVSTDTGATQINYEYATVVGGGAILRPLELPDGAKSWAILDENGHIYIGENTEVAKSIYITIT